MDVLVYNGLDIDQIAGFKKLRVVSRLKCNSDFESDNFLGEYLLWRQKA